MASAAREAHLTVDSTTTVLEAEGVSLSTDALLHVSATGSFMLTSVLLAVVHSALTKIPSEVTEGTLSFFHSPGRKTVMVYYLKKCFKMRTHCFLIIISSGLISLSGCFFFFIRT